MRTAVLLCAGDGTRLWPYADMRPKAMVPIANKPVVAHQVDLLAALGFERAIVVGGAMSEQLANYFALARNGYSASGGMEVTVVRANASGPRGTAFSLAAASEAIGGEPFLVLYGDTLLDKDDVARLAEAFEGTVNGTGTGADAGTGSAAVLVSELGRESSNDWICCRLSASRTAIESIAGHPRGDYTHRFCAFAFPAGFLRYASRNSGVFTNVEVGMMPPSEGYLEMSLADWLADGHSAAAVEAQGMFVDIDKPWQILQANDMLVKRQCEALAGHELAEGASIDASATINGFVKLGRNSRIGRNVVVEGNAIVGEGTTIENGALLLGNHVIGDETYIGNYCYLSAGSTVGSHCVINHCAELDGMIMDRVYLYHYMEFYGIIGMCTDLGAATVCGTLRFDDGETVHRVKGRREKPLDHSNAVYLGDYARTGVNAILMPGVKVGSHSVVGPGVLLHDDVPSGTMVSLKQELATRAWGPRKYGW